ncbi:MAG: M48 family metallopeptidase [Bacteroidia bacterium]
MRWVRDFAILITIFGGIWLIFTYFPIIPDKEYFKVPIETEKKIGDAIFEYQIENNSDFEIVEDPKLDSMIHLITSRLITSLDNPLFQYQFYIVSSEEVNAFTIPGGRIFIYAGLIETAESAEEVASVLAHEIGHAEERHVMNKLAKEIGLSVLLSDDSFVLGQVSKTLGSSKFDRIQERKADEFALELLENSLIDPRHFGSFMMKMKEKEQFDSDMMEIVNTHPATDRRIKHAMNYELDSEFKEEPIAIDWDEMLLTLSSVTASNSL